MTRGLHPRLAAILILLLAAACTSAIEVCSLLGCSSGLTVKFDRTPDIAYQVAARTNDPSPRFVFDCPNPSRCVWAFFADYTPGLVIITVTTSRGSRDYTVSPHYETSRPNGPNCSPECRNAIVTVAFP